jgi:hypothetical protein
LCSASIKYIVIERNNSGNAFLKLDPVTLRYDQLIRSNFFWQKYSHSEVSAVDWKTVTPGRPTLGISLFQLETHAFTHTKSTVISLLET